MIEIVSIMDACESKTRNSYPERQNGHWIKKDNPLTFGKMVECSECHQRFVFGDSASRNFCVNCGADMREITCDDCFIADTDACPMGGRAEQVCDAFFEKGVEH